MLLATGFAKTKPAASAVPLADSKHAVHCDAFDQKWQRAVLGRPTPRYPTLP